jgi:hypothetical protein
LFEIESIRLKFPKYVALIYLKYNYYDVIFTNSLNDDIYEKYKNHLFYSKKMKEVIIKNCPISNIDIIFDEAAIEKIALLS